MGAAGKREGLCDDGDSERRGERVVDRVKCRGYRKRMGRV